MTYIFKILIKKTKIFSFFFILLFIMPSCSKKVKSYGYIKTKINNQYQIDYSEYVLSPSQKDLIISFSEIPQNLNPYRANSSAELFFKQALFSSIFYLDPKSEIPTKNLIDKYFVSYDGLEYNFTLKDNVKFSNGTKLNSDDVIASLSLLDTILKDTSLYNNFYIFNKKLEAEKLSSLKFTISTDKPNTNIAYALSNFPIIPKIIAEKIAENLEVFVNYWDIFKNNQIIGSGPYILEKIDDNEAIFVKNPYYFKVDSKNNRLPYTERIIVKFYKGENKEILGFINGESDVLSLQTHDYHNLYQYYNKSNVQSVKFIDTNFSLNRILVVYNCYNEDSKSYLKDLSFREYISSFISDAGSKHNDFFIDSSTKYGSNLSSNADSLLKDVNYDGILEYKDGNTVFLRIIVPKEDMQLVKIAEIATLTLKELNMDVFLEKIPYHLFLERLFYTKDY
ncbi:MAG: hypothetical protein KAT05_01395, partial [Spirochaetes bacterium]|nr:hypothetical protein [Spirochaetota bacterium]